MTIDKSLYRPVRKPRALPPKLTSIIKLKNGGNVENDDNVIPFVNPNEKPWYESMNNKETVEEYLARKEIEFQKSGAELEALRYGIGTLFRKKI